MSDANDERLPLYGTRHGCESFTWPGAIACHAGEDKKYCTSVNRVFLYPTIVRRSKQAILEGRQQLPSDYWKEFARGPYFIIVGESTNTKKCSIYFLHIDRPEKATFKYTKAVQN